MATCYICKHHFLDRDNNDRCEKKHYPESNIIRRNWGQWTVDANKCPDLDYQSRNKK